jgi:hypothetical protein
MSSVSERCVCVCVCDLANEGLARSVYTMYCI